MWNILLKSIDLQFFLYNSFENIYILLLYRLSYLLQIFCINTIDVIAWNNVNIFQNKSYCRPTHKGRVRRLRSPVIEIFEFDLVMHKYKYNNPQSMTTNSSLLFECCLLFTSKKCGKLKINCLDIFILSAGNYADWSLKDFYLIFFLFRFIIPIDISIVAKCIFLGKLSIKNGILYSSIQTINRNLIRISLRFSIHLDWLADLL